MFLSQQLYKLRKEQNISLQKLSEATGISPASLSAYEKGLYAPSLENLCTLASYFHVTLDELAGRI